MLVTRILRTVLVATLCGLCLVTTSVTAAPSARAQQCVPAGADIAPVPWPQKMLAPQRVWPLATGQGQRVAIIGTGVASNPQLEGQVIGKVDLSAKDEKRSAKAVDCLGIGTGVAGIIAAKRTDATGFRGMAPGARLLSAKVVGDEFPSNAGQAVPPEVLASAIDWAIGKSATVIAVTTTAYEDSADLRRAVRKARTNDIVIVAATGEVKKETPLSLAPYPATYDGVVGVSGIGRNGVVTDASRSGHVDLVAPGYEVVTTYPGDGLGAASGSAFATGYVAGSVALARSYRPQASAEETIERMLATAAPAPEGVGSARYGYGVVDPYQAVVENVVAGEPAALPPMVKDVPSDAELARAKAQQRSDSLAFTLAACGGGLAVVVTTIVVFGPRGRRRRWRSGLADAPHDRPEDDLPEPPAELFGDRNTGSPQTR